MIDPPRLFKQIDQQTFAARARGQWLAPPQPFRQADLQAILQAIHRDMEELARVTMPPPWLLEVPRTSVRRPRLRDRLWSRARRLLFRASRR